MDDFSHQAGGQGGGNKGGPDGNRGKLAIHPYHGHGFDDT